MQIADGGELFDLIIKKGHFSEEEVRKKTKIQKFHSNFFFVLTTGGRDRVSINGRLALHASQTHRSS